MTQQPGARLGPYEIVSALGAGGMGEVYRARDMRLDRIVAIKVLRPEVAGNPARRERFEREARTGSRLSHPHICTLYDVGHHDGVDFLVMEHCEGDTLDDRLAKRPLRFDQILRHAVEIAEGLDAAHRQGITHRDLKPANIMLTNGGVKLLDFGLAKWREDEGRAIVESTVSDAAQGLTGEGTILGTLHYMAPEQLEGKDIDGRADIFALGAVLYEMATGRKAFDGTSRASVIAAILEREPSPINPVQPLAPPGFERVVMKCLAKDPDERWQSVRDLAASLKWMAEASQDVRGARATARARTSQPLRRERAVWVAVVALLLATIAGLGYQLRESGRAGAGRPRVRLAVHRQGTVAHLIATGLFDVLNRTLSGVDVELVEEPGMISTMRGIDSGHVDLGLAFNLVAFHAVKTEQVLGHRSDAITALTVAYANPAQIVVRSDSNVKTIADLKGKRVSLGIPEAGGRFCSQILLSHLGFDADDLSDQSIDFGPSLENLLEGRLDAKIDWRGMPVPDFAQAFVTGKLRLIPLDLESLQGLRLKHPFLVPWTIPARVYPHQDSPVPTVSARMLLLASSALSADLVDQVLRSIAAHMPDLIARHPAAAEINVTRKPTLDEGLSINLHPGAERFFESSSTRVR